MSIVLKPVDNSYVEIDEEVANILSPHFSTDKINMDHNFNIDLKGFSFHPSFVFKTLHTEFENSLSKWEWYEEHFELVEYWRAFGDIAKEIRKKKSATIKLNDAINNMLYKIVQLKLLYPKDRTEFSGLTKVYTDPLNTFVEKLVAMKEKLLSMTDSVKVMAKKVQVYQQKVEDYTQLGKGKKYKKNIVTFFDYWKTMEK